MDLITGGGGVDRSPKLRLILAEGGGELAPPFRTQKKKGGELAPPFVREKKKGGRARPPPSAISGAISGVISEAISGAISGAPPKGPTSPGWYGLTAGAETRDGMD